MRRLLCTLFLLAGCAGAAERTPPPALLAGDLTGSYTREHPITHFDGKDWVEATVRDTLALQQGGDTLGFYFMLVHTNFHTCEMEGTAMRDGDGFRAPDEVIDFGGEKSVCRLRLQVSADSLRLGDEDGACRSYYCGARGAIDGITFARHEP